MKSLVYTRTLRCNNYCEKCGRISRFRRRAANHHLQFVITVMTLGLWGISWLAIWWSERNLRWRCQTCFTPVKILPVSPVGNSVSAPSEEQPAPSPDSPTDRLTNIARPSASGTAIRPRLLPRFIGELRAR